MFGVNFLASNCRARDNLVEEASAATEKRLSKIAGLTFEYESTFESKMTITSHNAMSYKHNSSKNISKIHRLWRQFDNATDLQPRKFFAADNDICKLYIRKPVSEGSYSQGYVWPFPEYTKLDENTFDRIVLAGLFDLDRKKDQNRSLIGIFESNAHAEKITHEGRNALLIKSAYNGPYVAESIVLTAPYWILVKSFVREGDRAIGGGYEITEIGEFDGFYYPKTGSWHQKGGGILPDIKYKFTVAKVYETPKATLDAWIPDFPSGTTVMDHRDGTTGVIDFSQEQIGAIIAKNVKARGYGFWNYFAILNILVLIGAVLAWSYRNWWRRK